MKFRKKPIVVEAKKLHGNYYGVFNWIKQNGGSARLGYHDGEPASLFINTLEGIMTADANDWIVRGIGGEFYPVKPDIFAMTYEPTDEEPTT